MARILAFLGLGIVLLLSGIVVFHANFYAGVAVMGIGVVLTTWFKIEFMKAVLRWSTAKAAESRKKRELRN